MIRQVIIDIPVRHREQVRIRFIEVFPNRRIKVVERFLCSTISSCLSEMRQWLEKGEMTE